MSTRRYLGEADSGGVSNDGVLGGGEGRSQAGRGFGRRGRGVGLGEVGCDDGILRELGVGRHVAVEALVEGADDVRLGELIQVVLGQLGGGGCGGRGGRGLRCRSCERLLAALSSLSLASSLRGGSEPTASSVFAAGVDCDGVFGGVEAVAGLVAVWHRPVRDHWRKLL